MIWTTEPFLKHADSPDVPLLLLQKQPNYSIY